jgi:S-adenosylmethionine:tRNA ribosyltransferase-isomerase
VLVSDFEFELPDDLIAHAPVRPRDASRLLRYDRRRGQIEHAVFSELPRFLSPDDVLIVNNTRVMPYRLHGRRETGARVEVLILTRAGDTCSGYVKPSKKVRPGERVPLESGRLILIAKGPATGGGILEFVLETPDGSDVEATLLEVGRAPLPPYIARDGSEDPEPDRRQYQTVFAEVSGAVAAPTAGLHFTPELLDAIRAVGVRTVEVTLHVGAGTFAPIRVENVEEHEMHSEWFSLSSEVADAVAETRERGGRVVAVGTTAARTLESNVDPERRGHVIAGAGDTEIFLYPGRELRVVDALITNFHLPRSTLLMLVAAFAGREEILDVYREAVAEGYRFYSFGDAMLIC